MKTFSKIKIIYLFAYFISIAFLAPACSKDETTVEPEATLPTLNTKAVASVTQTTASSGGNITADGGATVTARGICWSINSTPTINDSKTTDGSGTGSFSSNITGLTVNTKYYVRAYATNSAGTGYGEEIQFTTLAGQPEYKGAYVGQTPPENTPRVFAPGFICKTNQNEWSLSFSPEGNEVYFYRVGSEWYCKIYYSKIIDGIWSEPQELPLSDGYNALQPHITPDNNKLYFAWNVGNAADPNGITGGIYVSKRSLGGDWGTPTYFGKDLMYFTSSEDSQLYTTDISQIATTGKTYLAKVNIENGKFKNLSRLNIKPYYGQQAHPCIAPDGSYIVFDVGGGEYMFVSFKKSDGTWGDAIDLTTKGFDKKAGGAYISPDGKYLFYHLNGDIYWVSTNVITSLR